MEAESGADQEQNGHSSARPVSIPQETNMTVQAKEGLSCCHCGVALSEASCCRHSGEIAWTMCVRLQSHCDD